MTLDSFTLPITFDLTDKPAFWAALAEEAARIDEEEGRDHEGPYSQAQAFIVVFQHDGLKGVRQIMKNDGDGAHLGWATTLTWDELADIGDKIGAPTDTCRHCGRPIGNVNGTWIDPAATGDDSVWRETCDAHDTFQAEHEPTVKVA